MKNSEEMVNSLLKRREQYIAEHNQKRKIIMKITTAVFSLCLVAFIGYGVWQSGILKSALDQQNEVVKDLNKEGTPKPDKTDVALLDKNMIIWAKNDTVSEEGFTEWKNKNISYRLMDALESGEENSIYAILARPVIDNTFEYQGKSIEEYYFEMSELPEILSQLLKEGDSLKYEEALYETGTPDGEKWTKQFYEERIEYYGKEILEKYIVDGQFLRKELENDLAVSMNKEEAKIAYNKAVEAYLTNLTESLPGSFLPEVHTKTNSIIIYLTKDEFDSFTVDNLDEWYFDLAAKDNDTEQLGEDE